MATKIEDIYDALITAIESQLTGYKRIPNPYALELNSHLILQKGYGLQIGSGRDTHRTVGCLITWERLFIITITEQITTTENNLTARGLLEKLIIANHDKLIRYFYANPTFTGLGYKVSLEDDSGIQPIVTEKGKYFSMDMSLFVEYQETIP